MTKKILIEQTIKIMNLLPEDKVLEISEFADFLRKRYEEQFLSTGIMALSETSSSLDFLNHEDDLYQVSDLKVDYLGQG